MGSLGSFAGGLAGGFQDAENNKSVRDWRAQETARQKLANEQAKRKVDSARGPIAQLSDDVVGRLSPPSAPNAVRNPDYEPGGGGAATVAGAPGYGAQAPGMAPGAADPAMNMRQQLAETFKQNGLHGLARGMAPPADAEESAPMLTMPSANADSLGLMQPSPAVPNLTQIAAQAATRQPVTYDKTKVFGA